MPTSTTLSLLPDPAASLDDVSATVDPHPSGGTVQFTVDGTPTGTVPVAASTGVAVVALPLAAGSHVVRAQYSGIAGFTASTVSESVVVDQDPTTLVVAVPQLVSPEAVEFQATLTSEGEPLSDAPVWFSADEQELCTGTTDQSGSVSCTVSEATTGAAQLSATGVSATYGGDRTHLPVTAQSPGNGSSSTARHGRPRSHNSGSWTGRQPSWTGSGTSASSRTSGPGPQAMGNTVARVHAKDGSLLPVSLGDARLVAVLAVGVPLAWMGLSGWRRRRTARRAD